MQGGESKVIYAFQAILMGVAAYASYKQQLGAWVSPLIFIGLWWSGLIIFAGQPAAGYFEAEREYLSKLRNAESSTAKQACSIVVFCFLFWPIFIPKGVYLALLALGGCVYYFLKSH